MTSLHDRLLAICLFYDKLDKIPTLNEFIEKVSSSSSSATTPQQKKNLTDDAIVQSVLKTISRQNNNNSNNDDDDDDENHSSITILEPPLEKRKELLAAFLQQQQQQQQEQNQEFQNKQPIPHHPTFTPEEAEKKFALPFLLDQEALDHHGIVKGRYVNTFISKLDVDSRVAGLKSIYVGDFDNQGVYLYAAFNDTIAKYALEHQTFNGCEAWNTSRTTWIKPSLAWVCYRSGYGKKPNQNNVLRIQISHQSLASILSQGTFVDTNKDTRSETSMATSSSCGADTTDNNNSSSSSSSSLCRIQFDPERDLFTSDDGGKTPREMMKRRAIQIGVAGKLSQQYVDSILKIEDCTDLVHKIGAIHKMKSAKQRDAAMVKLINDCPPSTSSVKSGKLEFIPLERPYFPALCSNATLISLGMLPGVCADAILRLGRGKAR